MNLIVKYLLISAGTISVGLGIIGIILPILPTTPFLLLGAAAYIKASDSMYNWLIHHKWFGSYIKNYRDHKGMTLKHKVISIATLWISIILSAVFAVDNIAVSILLIVIAISVTLFLLSFKTLKNENIDLELINN